MQQGIVGSMHVRQLGAWHDLLMCPLFRALDLTTSYWGTDRRFSLSLGNGREKPAS